MVYRGAAEIRIKGAAGIYRVFYCPNNETGVLIAHAFMKESQKTPLLEIQLARKRLMELLYGQR